MHYRHGFHAGNFADVFKHALLCALLEALNRKDAPWFYLETHSGAGMYDLTREESERTGEYHDGIERIWTRSDAPAAMQTFMKIARAASPDGVLRGYPGSPVFAQAIARPQDRMALCEKVPAVAEDLRISLGRDKRIAVHERDGYEAYALLPPAEKRGLTLVDPPFERRDEFEAVSDFLQRAIARFANGICAAWYPLKNLHEAKRFVRRQERELGRPALRIEFDTGAHAEGQLRGCGMLVVNPPFGFDAQARTILAFLSRRLAQGPKPQWSVAPLKEKQ
jgi:23S rRNA (adenine2030-N6)-methyltransferase